MSMNDIQEKLREIYKMLIPQAKQNLEERGALTPTVFGLKLNPEGRDELLIIGASFSNYEEKRAAYDDIGRMLHEKGCCGAVLFNEAWSVHPKPGEDYRGGPPLSERPDRIEIVAATLCTWGWTESYILPFHRDSEKIVWEEEISGGKIQNNLFRAFDEGVQ